MTDRFWMGDTHVHTTVSDGELSPREVALVALVKGLDFIAVTDHHTARGADETWDYAQAAGLPLTVLRGQEIQCENHVHFVMLGQCRSFPETRLAAIPGLADEVHAAGGAVILAHPWTAISKPPEFLARLDRLFGEGKIDALEIFTSSLKVPKFEAWRQMVQHYWRHWRPYNPGVVGSTDWHHRNHGLSIGLGQTYVEADASGGPSLIRAVRERRTVAAVSRLLAAEATIYDRLAEEVFSFRPDDDAPCWRENFFGPAHLVAGLIGMREAAERRLAERSPSPDAAWVMRHAAMSTLLQGNYRRAMDLLSRKDDGDEHPTWDRRLARGDRP